MRRKGFRSGTRKEVGNLPPPSSLLCSFAPISLPSGRKPPPSNPVPLWAFIPVPGSLFPPQTSRRPAPRPPGLARAAAPSPSPSPPLPTCWESGSRRDQSTRQVLAARASPLSPRGPASSKPRRPGLDRPAARPSGARMRSSAPACARHSHAPCAPSQSATAGPHRAALAFARRSAAGPPPGHRAAPALRLAGSRPPRHILTRPPSPFLPAGVQASRGGGSRLGSAASPAAGPAVSAAE
ncbi:atherin-like [Ursus americanus]|uniref:atherin-like n=1 Tax=Ursus americanus TaxID=9643 RepID=UPI001E679830|nr:atherin-like [Ursus americanus]